ncbi:MAG: co-chaperone DjlA [Thiohalomonadales bacterium]
MNFEVGVNHWGKVIGAFVGYLLAGIFGSGVGVALGFIADRYLVSHHPPRFTKINPENLRRIRSEFFTASFSVMGYVSQASGRVGDADAGYAMKVIERMGLPADSRESAIELFKSGKSTDFSLHKVVSQFYLDCRDQPSLLEMFLEIQLYAAFSDGGLTNSEKDIIQNIAYQLDFSAMEFERIEGLIRAECRQAENSSRKKRQAEEQWEQQLKQGQVRQKEFNRKQQRIQKKARVDQEKANKKAQIDRQKAAFRAEQAKVKQQERIRRVHDREQKKAYQQRQSNSNSYAYEGMLDQWTSNNSSPLDDAYAILNMPRSASNEEIKKAYRRLTSKHHPDKLVAKGLPPEMMKVAEVKTREIRAAYEHIREVRNF